jgi:hypothetical protein
MPVVVLLSQLRWALLDLRNKTRDAKPEYDGNWDREWKPAEKMGKAGNSAMNGTVEAPRTAENDGVRFEVIELAETGKDGRSKLDPALRVTNLIPIAAKNGSGLCRNSAFCGLNPRSIACR